MNTRLAPARPRLALAGAAELVPALAALAVVAGLFQALDGRFLSSANLSQLLLECVPVGVVALGVVCVLVTGDIDVSVGAVSGLCAALLAVLWVDRGVPGAAAIVVALLLGLAIGVVYAVLVERARAPSLAVTAVGLLLCSGAQLLLLGGRDVIGLPFDAPLVEFAQRSFVPADLSYVLVAVAVLAWVAIEHRRARRARHVPLVGAVVLLVGAEAFVVYLNRSTGVGWAVVLLIALVLAMHATLARGRLTRGTALVCCAGLAGLGGVLAAARLGAAGASTGGGDVTLIAFAAAAIGGASLFGGRGTAFAALLGILVLQAIANGLALIEVDTAYRLVAAAGLLALAVARDRVRP